MGASNEPHCVCGTNKIGLYFYNQINSLGVNVMSMHVTY